MVTIFALGLAAAAYPPAARGWRLDPHSPRIPSGPSGHAIWASFPSAWALWTGTAIRVRWDSWCALVLT